MLGKLTKEIKLNGYLGTQRTKFKDRDGRTKFKDRDGRGSLPKAGGLKPLVRVMRCGVLGDNNFEKKRRTLAM